MNKNLIKLKDLLEKEGVVEVTCYDNQNELAINEKYFCYDSENGECDLYYIKVTFEDNKFKVETCFCEGDFLSMYDNKLDYINEATKRVVLDDAYYIDLIIEEHNDVNYSKAILILNHIKDFIKEEHLSDFIKDDLRIFFDKKEAFNWLYDSEDYYYLINSLNEIVINSDMNGKTLTDALIEGSNNCLKLSNSLYLTWTN